MKYNLILFCFSLILSLHASAVQPAHIQIMSEPGIDIFLNGENVGQTRSDLGGLFLEDVASGRHQIRAHKPGYSSKSFSVLLNAGQVFLLEIEMSVPNVSIRQDGKRDNADLQIAVGSLVIQSIPVECYLTCVELGWARIEKNRDKFIVDNIPVGEYRLIVEAMGRTLIKDFSVASDVEQKFLFNFNSSTVVDVGELERISEEERLRANEKLREASIREARERFVRSFWSGAWNSKREFLEAHDRTRRDLNLSMSGKNTFFGTVWTNEGLALRNLPDGTVVLYPAQHKHDGARNVYKCTSAEIAAWVKEHYDIDLMRWLRP